MSEYQYYEFLAIDRPLSDAEQAKVGSLSTRATITATSFVNEYHWGDFRGDPDQLMARYYDAHLYVANWGSHRLMLRLPADLLDPVTVEDYCDDDQLSARVTDKFIVLDFTSEDEAREFEFDYDGRTLLAGLVGVRTELATGDLRPLYLAWLAGYGRWERDEDAFDREADDDLEPPVPPGLGKLTAPQQALADFLRLDNDLLAIAARTSPPLETATDDPTALATWVAHLPAAEKNRFLTRVAQGESSRVQAELLRRFRGATAPASSGPARRKVAELLDEAAHRRAEVARRLAAQQAKDEAHRRQARLEARERRLDKLAGEKDAAWSRIDALIATKKPAEYDAAVILLADLRTLAERENHHEAFTLRATTLRQAQARKVSFIQRLDQAGL